MTSQYAIETKDLTKYYGIYAAVDHLNLSIPKGCIYGLLGRNGAGKSTTIRMLLNFARPTCGMCRIEGCDSRELTPELLTKIGYINEGHKLYGMMKISEIQQYQASFYPDTWNNDLFNEMIEFFELAKNKRIKKLSNGQRAQVSLALTLAPDPEILIMDDPTLGLDVVVRRQFLEGMIKLIQRKGRTILFSSHILSDVERVADHIAIINQGRLRADCTMEEFRSAVRKVILHFDSTPPRELAIPGLLHYRQDEKTVEAVLIAPLEDALEQWCIDNNANIHSEVEMSLEDQFIEYTITPTKRHMFSWDQT